MDAASVQEIFAAFGEVRCRRMFGGLGVYSEGVMFALVARGDLYLKADPAFARSLEDRGARPFVYEASGKSVNLGYWSLPEAALDNQEDAADLARAALRVALAAKARKSRPKGTGRG